MRTHQRKKIKRGHAPGLCRFVLLALTTLEFSPASAAGWAGRPLLDVIAELRAEGVQLLYSTQVVTPDLRVASEPRATSNIARLQESLRPLGLDLQRVESGYAIVRATPAVTPAPPEPVAASLEEITVFASRYSVTREVDPEALDLSHTLLQKAVGIEADALRAVHYFPGAASNNLSALTHVRGGAESETLVQFDDTELYRPTHLKDFQSLFGLIDPELVQSMDYFAGGFPARYGNRSSGVIDIQPRHTDDTQNMLGASVLYARAISSGSFDDQQGSWLVGYRRSTLPAVLRQLESKIGEPEFDDFVGRIEHRFGSVNVALGTLLLNDDLHLFTPDATERASAHYRDVYGWLNLRHELNERIASDWHFSSATLDASRQAGVAFDRIGNGTLDTSSTTRILTAKMLWTVATTANTTLEFGARSDRSSVDYGYASDTQFLLPLQQTFGREATQSRRVDNEVRGSIHSAHASLRGASGRFSGELGLRWDDYTYIDAQRFSPRLSLRYALSESDDLRLSVGRYVQGQTLAETDHSQVLPVFYAPESSRQLILGFDHRFENALALRVEAYAKRNDHTRPYYENLLDDLTLAAELRVDRTLIEPQSYTARGVEVSLRNDPQAALNWSLAYTRSEARDRINGASVPRSWDQPHAFTATFALTRPRWQYSGAFSWHTGWPYTPLVITQSADGDTASLGPRNSQRYDDFVSVDLRVQYTWPLRSSSLEAFVEARNALSRNNDCCRDVSVSQNESGARVIQVEYESGLTIVPLAGINWRF